LDYIIRIFFFTPEFVVPFKILKAGGIDDTRRKFNNSSIFTTLGESNVIIVLGQLPEDKTKMVT